MQDEKPLNEQPEEPEQQEDTPTQDSTAEQDASTPEQAPDTAAPVETVNPFNQPQPGPAPAMPTQQPIGSAQPMMAQPAMAPAPKAKKKWLLPVIILAIVVLVLSGGGIGAYAWYQSPQKVVDDGLMSMMSSANAKVDAQLVMDMDEATLTMNMNLDANETAGQGTMTIKVEAPSDSPVSVLDGIEAKMDFVIDESDNSMYFRVNDLQPVYEKFRDAMIESILTAYMNYYESYDQDEMFAMVQDQVDETMLPTIKKLDGQWIKASLSDFDELTSSNEDSVSCTLDAVAKIGDDKAIQQQLVDAYTSNAFIRAGDSLGTKNGAVGYSLTIDNDKMSAFKDAVKETDFGKDIAGCDAAQESADASSTLTYTSVEMWVDQWSHKPRHLTVKAKDSESSADITYDMNFDLDADVSVEIPSDTKTFDEIQSDIEDLLSATGSI